MKHELLAPAGSLDICKAVIHAGADAVYLGGSKYGARAFAQNFSESEVLEALDFAHLYGRRIMLTVNTLLKNREMGRKLYEYLKPFYEHGLDAVIVQDYGVFQFVRKYFPGASGACQHTDVCGKCAGSPLPAETGGGADCDGQGTVPA